MLSAFDVPPAPTRTILARAKAAPLAEPPRATPYARFALVAGATVVLIFAAFPKASIALVERIVIDGYAAAYRVMGWTPPPSPPRALENTATSAPLSLGAARAKVSFTVVPPTGLPPGAVLAQIRAVSVLAYDKATHVWSKDSPALAFEYHRADGRTFQLLAEKDDPRTGPPPRFMYEAEDLPGGKVALTGRMRYAWTNGDQMTSAIADGISPTEILTIRAAMNGQPVLHNATETVTKRYSLGP
jgi:hypothetical protein